MNLAGSLRLATTMLAGVVAAGLCTATGGGALLGNGDAGSPHDDAQGAGSEDAPGSNDGFVLAFGDTLGPPPVIEPECSAGKPCPATKICLSGACQDDPCATAPAKLCAAGTACRAGCVTIVDKCAGVKCPDKQSCFDGQCVAGCFRDICTGVVCKDGEYCSPSSGKCQKINTCNGLCPAGTTCNLACLAPGKCDNIKCKADELCANGVCMANPCHDVACPAGSVCSNGACVDTCDCKMTCAMGSQCLQGQCVCTPQCAAGTCGGSDGCGGKCPCATAGQKCYMNKCCLPTCPADGSKACMDDGCGGTCGCLAGAGSCYMNKCCVPNCPAGGGKACMDNGCGGLCPCPGGRCNMNTCCLPTCPADGSKACMPDGCGQNCPCPAGKGACYMNQCCLAQCPANGDCGGANGCGGTCGCPKGSTCTNGKCSAKVCAPVCKCSEFCYDGVCLPLECGADQQRCGCTCCDAGYSCVLGQCKPTITP